MFKKSKQAPTRAVALQYQQDTDVNNKANKNTPKVTAKGQANVADEIIALAKQHGVLIHKDDELSQLLSQLDLGQEIPEGLYHVIAELIAFSYVLQGKFPSAWTNTRQHIDFTE